MLILGSFKSYVEAQENMYKLFSPGVVRQLKAKAQGGISAAGCVGCRMLARR